MKKATRSILEELNNLNFNRNKEHLIETTGANQIDSAINLFEQINEHYSEEEALELERRCINSVKSADSRKFKRGVQKINESKKT